MIFAFKKVVSLFLFPVAILGYLFLAGLLLLWWKEAPGKNQWGRRLIAVAALGFFILGSDWVGNGVLVPLTHRFDQLDVASLQAERGEDWSPDYIVVLGGGHAADPDLPAANRISIRTLARINEAYRLHRAFPTSPILATGGKLYPDFHAISLDMTEALRDWGVREDMLLAETESRDTKDHVRYLEDRLGGKSFLLVTSATHMPRSMALFRHAGLNPVACPVPDFRPSLGEPRDWWKVIIPKAGNFVKIEAAAYEYLGLGWAKLRGQI